MPWRCVRCTFDHHAPFTVCYMCGSRQHNKTNAELAAAVLPPRRSRDHFHSLTPRELEARFTGTEVIEDPYSIDEDTNAMLTVIRRVESGSGCELRGSAIGPNGDEGINATETDHSRNVATPPAAAQGGTQDADHQTDISQELRNERQSRITDFFTPWRTQTPVRRPTTDVSSSNPQEVPGEGNNASPGSDGCPAATRSTCSV